MTVQNVVPMQKKTFIIKINEICLNKKVPFLMGHTLYVNRFLQNKRINVDHNIQQQTLSKYIV